MAHSHLKRLVAPKTWPILRKTTKYISRPKPNGQKMTFTMPVIVIMRDVLKLVTTASEAKKILRSQEVLINGRRAYETDDTVGFMDVLAIPGQKTAWRMLINKNSMLELIPITGEEVGMKLCKLSDKKTLGKNKIQLCCSDGRNIIVPKDEYKTGDSLAVTFDNKITAHYALEKGATVLLVGGSHIGTIGVVESVEGSKLIIKSADTMVETHKKVAYVIGKGKTAIKTG